MENPSNEKELLLEWATLRSEIEALSDKLSGLKGREYILRCDILTLLRQTKSDLTPREQEVLRQVQLGLGNKEIAWNLHISERTVKYHVTSLLRKFEVRDRIGLLRKEPNEIVLKNIKIDPPS